MKNLLTPVRAAAALLLGGWACAGGAQSLGMPAVDPLLGRPLDMAVPARFASGDGSDECVHADVFYGETRLPASRVRAYVGGPPQQRTIRIESDVPVDEPVVVVSLRAGCRGSITRNYTLLPAYPSERMLAAADARAALAQAVPVVPLKAAPAVASTSPRRAAPRTALAADRSGVATVAQASQRAPRNVPAAQARLAAAGGPRLRLEPIDLPEQVHALRTSATLAQPQGDAARRATAALLWQAINADPQDLLRASVRLQRMEQELGQLRQAAGQTHAELVVLRQRLEQAQPWYASNVLAQVLGILVLAAAAAGGMLWYRTRRMADAGNWYVPREAAAGAALDPVSANREEVQAPQPASTLREPVAPLPVALPRVEVPQPAAPRRPAPQPAIADEHIVDFEIPRATLEPQHPGGALRVETLAATFEEAEFLSSLGLYADAMDVLKAYLQDSGRPAPVAYYELMLLCDRAQDAVAVATVRRRHAQALRVEAPRLEQVTADVGLDGMPALAARIQRAWGGPGALDAIEQALFEAPTAGAPLTLRAARELLFLYDVALVRATQGTAQPADAAEGHPVAPWAHAEDTHAAGLAAQAVADAQGGEHFGLDLDLTAPVTPSGPVLELELEPLEALEPPPAQAQAGEPVEEEDAFSAAVASERVPVSRY